MTTLLLSAYPALAAPVPLTHPEQREIYARLRDEPAVGAVELPLDASGRIPDEELVLSQLSVDWDVVLTTVPGTIARIGQHPTFGLASDDAAGADLALEHLARCLDTARRVDAALGRRAVTGIAVVSAPALSTGARQDAADRLLDRLRTDWQDAPDGVRLLIEHCDALVPGQPAEKGFLDLDDEIRVVSGLRDAGHPTAGLVVNWGRSALEARSADGPVRHLERARAAGVLHALVLSGCADREGAFGPAWVDAHPPTADLPAPAGEPTSLLTEDEVRRSLAAAGEVAVVGMKFALRPDDLAPMARAEAVVTAFARVAALAAE